jgi:hypothetical protein
MQPAYQCPLFNLLKQGHGVYLLKMSFKSTKRSIHELFQAKMAEKAHE